MLNRYISFIFKLLLNLFKCQKDTIISDLKKNYKKTGRKNKEINIINAYREKLYANNLKLEYHEFGAGSRNGNASFKSIKSIAKTSGSSKRNGRLLNAVCRLFAPKQILELGTSLGLGTMYLNYNLDNCNIITIEANKSVSKFTENTFTEKKIRNVKFINDTFDNFFSDKSDLLSHHKTLIFIDGNHNYKATLKYFDICTKHLSPDSVIIFDDIRWSKNMYKAWKEIKLSNKIHKSIDLMTMGVVILGNCKNIKHHYLI